MKNARIYDVSEATHYQMSATHCHLNKKPLRSRFFCFTSWKKGKIGVLSPFIEAIGSNIQTVGYQSIAIWILRFYFAAKR
jgi:hypothetical protein